MSEPQFADLLRKFRTRARLTQQELADSAGISLRRINGLERDSGAVPQRETVRLLADALSLIGAERVQFETAARGRPLDDVPVAAAAAAMRSLPRDVASFTGRERELEQLASGSGVIGIHAIGGMAGVGKTAFAVHAAHRLADRFPGGQIFLQLHGHTPGQQPVDPADALANLLLAIGVSPAQVPPGLQARAALWRDRVAGKPLLLVLDDASGSDQVQPLLPGAAGSLVLVTSRRHLTALDDATAISLDTLPPDDAGELLVRLSGRAGLTIDDAGVREITALCGYLPLAVGMMARQLRHHPSWTAAGQAAELASARDRLELMETESLSVAAAFDLSYADLSSDQQRLFRRLGLHPGADIDAPAAAALDGTSLPVARRALTALYDQYLLAEPSQGRYRMHDLIREHARTQAERHESGEDQENATARLLDYYQDAATAADSRITRRTRPGRSAGRGAGGPAFADAQQALEWARAERANLTASLDHAAVTGQHARVILLTAGLTGLLTVDGPWGDAVTRYDAAVEAARHLGDRLGEANALLDAGEARRLNGGHADAVRDLEGSLRIYRELGDRLGQANAIYNLGTSTALTGDYPAATRSLEEALNIYRDFDDRRGQANALTYLGFVRSLTSEDTIARKFLEEALEICRADGDRLGQSNVLTQLGGVEWRTGDYRAAVRTHEEALGILRDLNRPLGQANSLSSLARVWSLTGDYLAASQAVEEALAIFRDFGDPRGVANALNYLGVLRRVTGDYAAAVVALDESLAIYRDISDREAEAEVLNERGTVHRLLGEYAPAKARHEQALKLSREISAARNEALALAGLGRCALAVGDAAPGEFLLRQALEIFQRIGSDEVPALEAELNGITNP